MSEEFSTQPAKQEDVFSIDAILKENQKEPDPPKNPTPKKKPARKKKWISSVVWMVSILVVSLALAFGVVVGAMDYLGIGKDVIYGSDTVQIDIAKGTSMTEIGSLLKENKIIMSETIFKIYTKVSGKADFQYGCHDFKPSMGYAQIVESLQQKAKKEDLEVTVKDTSTVDEIFELLEKKGVCTAESLYKALEEHTFESPLLTQAIQEQNGKVHYALEGFLYPDTYKFYRNDRPERVLQKMIDNLESKFTEEMRRAMETQGKSVNEVLTMASIIELESCGYFDEMANIAAVFYNRLHHWPAGSRKLQSDPTMKYPYGDGAYDTYQIEGLPPGPLCNPTQAAIQAAISPTQDFPYYFFVTDKFFDFHYSKTNGEHERVIARLKSLGYWLSE